jgi:hypothetical protein
VEENDRVVAQTALSGSRLEGGVYNYLPALKKVTAVYDHDTGSNYLDGYGQVWNKLSVFDDTVTFPNVSLNDSFVFRFSANINIEARLDQPYALPWRYILRFFVKIDDKTLSAPSQNLIVNGNPTTTILPNQAVWASGTNYYEISTAFTLSEYSPDSIP